MEFFKKFIETANSLLQKKKQSFSGSVSYKNSTTKHAMNSSCTMKLSSQTDKIKEEIDLKVSDVVKKYFHTPEKLVQYMKTQGIKIYRINKAEKILSFFGEEEGFITPLKGTKAILLNILVSALCGEKFSFDIKSKEMMIFDVNNTEIYTIARAFYKYTGYKNNLPGYDYKSQSTFKRLYSKRHHSSPFTGCGIEDMYACKEAIARDMESINFTINLSSEYENAKKAAKKISTDGAKI